GSAAVCHSSVSMSMLTGSPTGGGTSRPRRRSGRPSPSTPPCRTTRRSGSTGCWCRSASTSARRHAHIVRPARCSNSAPRSASWSVA
ncbi:MAG: Endonuclease III, partial [uncultured Thermomicrobiales bacterium]